MPVAGGVGAQGIGGDFGGSGGGGGGGWGGGWGGRGWWGGGDWVWTFKGSGFRVGGSGKETDDVGPAGKVAEGDINVAPTEVATRSRMRRLLGSRRRMAAVRR